jgi:hypothetical protein
MTPQRFIELVIEVIIAGGACPSTAYKCAVVFAEDFEARGMLRVIPPVRECGQ